MEKLFNETKRLVNEAKVIFVSGHRIPDGDAVGSSVGLIRVLRRNFPSKRIKLVGMYDIPEDLDWIGAQPSDERVALEVDNIDFATDSSIFIAVDCAAADRLNVLKDWKSCCSTGSKLINIDHHLSNPLYGDINIIDADASSACEVVARLCRYVGWEMTSAGANALYTGIVTDTNRFSLRTTSENTFECASFLIAQGANAAYTGFHVARNKSLGYLKARAKAIDSMKTAFNGKVAYTVLTRADFRDIGGDSEKSYEYGRYIVDIPQSLSGVLISFSVTEHDRETGVSLRAGGNPTNPFQSSDEVHHRFDMTLIATQIGSGWTGGGHGDAAGASWRVKGVGNEAELPCASQVVDTILQLIDKEWGEVLA